MRESGKRKLAKIFRESEKARESNERKSAARALRTLEERLPSGAQKEEFGLMIFEKNLSWGTVLNFSQRCRQLLVEVWRGAGTCGAPCILDHHCSSASP